MNKAVNNANAGTDQSDQHKTKNQLVIGDSTDKLANPRYGRSDPTTNVGKHGLNCVSGRSSRLKNPTFQKILFYIH